MPGIQMSRKLSKKNKNLYKVAENVVRPPIKKTYFFYFKFFS